MGSKDMIQPAKLQKNRVTRKTRVFRCGWRGLFALRCKTHRKAGEFVINRILGHEVGYDTDINGDGITDLTDINIIISAILGL